MSGGKSVFWARQMFNMSRAKQPRSFWIWIQDSEVLPTMAWGLRFCTVHESRQALYCLGIQCMLFTGLFYWHKENSFQETIWAGSVQQQLLATKLISNDPSADGETLIGCASGVQSILRSKSTSGNMNCLGWRKTGGWGAEKVSNYTKA